MKFYDIPELLEKAISDENERPYVRIAFELSDGEYFIPDSDIKEFLATSYKSTDGGIVNYGEIVLDNSKERYSLEVNPEYTTGLGIQVWYCIGDRSNTFYRFHFFVDSKGFQHQKTGITEKLTTIKLNDLSSKLDDIKLQKNWTDAQTIIHGTVCDKNHPDKSLVHIIASRGGISSNEINCGNLPFDIPFVKIENSAWKELCSLATAYNATVECGRDMKLTFTESPYDKENNYTEESSYYLNEDHITHYRFFNNYDNYANSIRLKYTRYEQTERQELWTYSDGPVWFDEQMNSYFPFTNDSRKIISDTDYEAEYTAKNKEGKYRTVVYTDELDSLSDFISSMEVTGSEKLLVKNYDTTTYNDKAIIQLDRDGKTIGLKKLSISGRAIVSETNYSVFLRDEEEIQNKGQIVKKVTSKYLTNDDFEGMPFCQRWASDLLKESKTCEGMYYITTYLPLIHGRVGSFMDLRLSETGKIKKVKIEEITFRYKKDEAFSTEIWVKNC